MEVSGQLHASAALPPGETAPYAQCVGGWVVPKSRSGHCGEEKNVFPLLVIKPRFLGGHPFRSLVAILTELSRFLTE
jgi:hypothetical protein